MSNKVINIADHRKPDPNFLNPDANLRAFVSRDEMYAEPEVSDEVVWTVCDYLRDLERGEHCKRCPRHELMSHGVAQRLCFGIANECAKYTTAALKKFPRKE